MCINQTLTLVKKKEKEDLMHINALENVAFPACEISHTCNYVSEYTYIYAVRICRECQIGERSLSLSGEEIREVLEV